MTKYYHIIRACLELLYFVTTPILAILAAWGLRQITVTKNNAKLSAKREAFRLAAEQCTRFMDIIVPKMNHYDLTRKSIKWDWLDNAKVEVLDHGFKVKTAPSDFDEEAVRPLLAAALDVANNLDSFAVFFTTGIASEPIAFSSVARTYCNQVRDLLPLIALGAESKEHYHHLLELYFLWNGRLNKTKLAMSKAQIEKRINDIGEHTVTPLGLEK